MIKLISTMWWKMIRKWWGYLKKKHWRRQIKWTREIRLGWKNKRISCKEYVPCKTRTEGNLRPWSAGSDISSQRKGTRTAVWIRRSLLIRFTIWALLRKSLESIIDGLKIRFIHIRKTWKIKITAWICKSSYRQKLTKDQIQFHRHEAPQSNSEPSKANK